jgi:hypothetical protein
MSEHLHTTNWPDCIPWTEPTKEHEPSAWGLPEHDLTGYDAYPYTHPAAASISGSHMGDVCPQCGKPLRRDETVVNIHGESGELIDVSPSESPVPCYHSNCYRAHRVPDDQTELCDFEA